MSQFWGPADRERSVRVEDVARVAGVSPITVSRALRTPEKVKRATLDRVLEAVHETGYQINSIASSLRSGQSAFVTVFVASLQNLHYAAATQGLIDAFKGSRYHLMFAQTGYAEEVDVDLLRSMLPFKPAAVVFSGIVLNPVAIAFLKLLAIPVMELWGEVPDPIDMLVMSPAHEGGRLIGEHLVAEGYKRIAYAGHTVSRSLPRIAGLREALARHGQDLALLLPMEGTTEMADGIAVFDRILEQLPDCDVMVFGTDLMAIGALVRAQQRGLSVPDQMAIAGYGDLFFSAHTEPQLTTVHMSPYRVGETAGRHLQRRLNGDPVGERIIEVPLQLMARGSTTRRKA